MSELEYFQQLPDHVQKDVARCVTMRALKKKELLFKENDIGDQFYIVMDGTLGIIAGGQHVGSIDKGVGFGEVALMTAGGRRTGTIQAMDVATVLCVSRADYKAIFLSKEAHVMQEKLT